MSNNTLHNSASNIKQDIKTRCYRFGLSLISILDGLPNQQSTLIISKQLLRSGTSIGANLFEATASSSRIEFKKYQEIALKSANESKYWIGLLRDSGKLETAKANSLLQELYELANMIAAGVLKLKIKNTI